LPALHAAMRDAERRFARPDGILLTGDLVQDDPEGYIWIREAFGASTVPVLCLPGNHDVPDHMNAALAMEPFQICGTRRFGRWSIVMLDSWIANDAAGNLGDAQLAALRETLKSHRNQHVMICLHHQPIPMGSKWLDQVGLRDSAPFMDIIRSNPNVRGVLWGHVHQSLDTFVNGVRFMATPATCAQFMPGSEDFALDDRPPGYRTLELMPDGSIVTEVCWLEHYSEHLRQSA
jgi:Icc protein